MQNYGEELIQFFAKIRENYKNYRTESKIDSELFKVKYVQCFQYIKPSIFIRIVHKIQYTGLCVKTIPKKVMRRNNFFLLSISRQRNPANAAWFNNCQGFD